MLRERIFAAGASALLVASSVGCGWCACAASVEQAAALAENNRISAYMAAVDGLTGAAMSAYGCGYEAAMDDSRPISGCCNVRGSRSMGGTITGRFYHADGDFTSLEIETDDGHIWIVDDLTGNLLARCLVEFDANGTDDVTDDSILYVTIYNDMR